MRRLLHAGYSDEQSGAIMTFLERIMALPDEVEARLEQEFADAEGTTMAQLMNRWERRGWERGVLDGRQDLLLELLAQQCAPLPPEIVDQVRSLPEAQLTALGQALLRFSSLDQLTAWLVDHAPGER
jgi:hypothetical protein